MSNDDTQSKRQPPANVDPKMRREVSRRGLLTGELRTAGVEAVRKLPSLSPFFGAIMRESTGRRDERLMRNLWQLLMGREPGSGENTAALSLMRNARTPEEKADALVDLLWALCQTREYEELNRPNRALIRGLYLIAMDRDPTDEERKVALDIMQEATDATSRVAALEGLFSGLLRSSESVLRGSSNRR